MGANSATPGSRFRRAMASERPLQVVGTINAYAAMQVEVEGFRAIYLSGSGVATASYGLPDLGMTSLQDVLTDVERITAVCDLPLLVDCDTGWGSALSIARTVELMEKAGVAAIHIEDQVAEKRCGHLPGKQVVSTSEMCDRLLAAADARSGDDFFIFARTDALASESLSQVVDRAKSYIEAGADGIFLEAVTEIGQFTELKQAIGLPVLANITEFGVTPLFTLDELRSADVDVALYPLSAFRAMSKSAESVYREIRGAGSQRGVLNDLQTRNEIYDVIGYYEYERKINELYEPSEG